MLKQLVQTLFSRTVMIPIGILTGIITARYFGPSERGLFTLLLMLPQTTAVFSSLGLDTAAIYLHRKHQVPLATLLANCIVHALGAGTLVGLALWIARPYLLAEIFVDASPAEYLIAIAAIPAVLLFHYLGGLSRAADRFDVFNTRSVLEKLLLLIAIAVLVILLRLGVFACLVAYLAILVGLCVWMIWDLRVTLGAPIRPNVGVMKRMMIFGGKTYAQALAAHTHYKVDLYLIAGYLSSADVAFYAIGAGLAERCLMLPDAIGLVMFPKMASQKSEDAARLTAKVCRNLLMLGTVTAIVLIVVGKPLVTLLYGVSYAPAVRPMYILMGGVVMVGITRVLMRFFTSVNQHHHNIYIMGSAAAFNIALNMVLIPRYGVLGAATSALITYTVQAIWAVVVFRRLTGLGARATLLADSADVRALYRMVAGLRLPLLAR